MEESEQLKPKQTRTKRNNMRRKGDGWQGSVVIDGKRHWPSGKTQAEVRNKIADMRSKSAKGEFIAPSKMTLRDYYLKEYLPSIRRGLEESSVKFNEDLWRWRIEPYDIADMTMTMLAAGTGRVNSWLTILEEKGRQDGGPCSPDAVNKSYVLLCTILNHAVAHDFLSRNPCVKLEHKPKKTLCKDDSNWWESDVLTDFLGDPMVMSYRLYVLLVLELDTGMRRGELCGLYWSYLDLEEGTITIGGPGVGNRTRINGVKILEKGVKARKGEDKSTTLSLSPFTIAVLKDWRKRQLEERMSVGPEWAGKDFVFTTPVKGSGSGKGSGPGHPYSPEGISQTWERIRDRWLAADPSRASLPKPTTHELRHSYASAVYDQTKDLMAVADRLTHKDTKMAEERYVKRRVKADRAVANQVGGILFKKAVEGQ